MLQWLIELTKCYCIVSLLSRFCCVKGTKFSLYDYSQCFFSLKTEYLINIYHYICIYSVTLSSLGPALAGVSKYSNNPCVVNMGVFSTASFSLLKLRKDVELWEICNSLLQKVPKILTKVWPFHFGFIYLSTRKFMAGCIYLTNENYYVTN